MKKKILEIRLLTLDQNMDQYYEYFSSVGEFIDWVLKQ